MHTLQRVACGLSLAALLAWAFPRQVQAVISFIPPITNRYDLGNTTKLFRSAVTHNLTVANFTSLNSTVNIYGAENVTGTLTCNALVGNSTLNTTGLATLDNATVNGTLAAAVVTSSGAVNGTATATLGNVVSNGTVNATSNATVGGELAVTGNASVAGTLYARAPVGATLGASNLTLTSANVGVVWVDGISGNRTVTLGTAASVGNGGWYEFRSLGNVSVNGNVTVNVTSAGNINGADTYAINATPWQVTRLVSNGSAYTATSSAP